MGQDNNEQRWQFGLRAYMIFVSLAAIGLAFLVGPIGEAWGKGGVVFMPYHLLGSEFGRLLPLIALGTPIVLIVFFARLVTKPPAPVLQVVWLLFLGICIGRPILVVSSRTPLIDFCSWALPLLLVLAGCSLVETWVRGLRPHRLTWIFGAGSVMGYWYLLAALLSIGL